ncbi:MAG: transglutaminase domain-containing protein [Betaproteobacteria bacterium]|nr:transglutaminase domain-containing protein [Betaproteobacteria bacterium]
MNTPALLLGAAILFWGWHSGHWAIAVGCALAFEAARVVPRRWEFTSDRLNRISDFSAVLAALAGVWLYFTLGNPQAIVQFFIWLPIVFLPLALSQAYGTHEDIEIGVIFRSLRRARRRTPMRFNMGYAYFALWIIAASAANRRDASFEAGLIVLAAWALWQARPRSRPLAVWLVLVPLAGGIGYAGQVALHDLQLWIEGNAPEWLRGEGGANTNPYRADTDIGAIGELKQSERIVLRVRPEAKLDRPLLLHRASYDTYTGLRWLAANAAFAPVAQSGSAGTWPLKEQPGEVQAVQKLAIIEQSGHVNPVLSLPSGSIRIEGLAASEMKRNALGAVQVEHRPGYVPYGVSFVPGAAVAAAPSPADVAVPRREAEILNEIAGALRLKGMDARAALAAVEGYFAENFTYSTYQPRTAAGQGNATAIADFLQRTRSGHCEYFATATVLLLRSAGIPARYATGFSVQEWSELERAYVARERHAHSWTRAWVDGAWRDVDTTPATWELAEAKQAPWWSRAADLWSWLRLRFFELQPREGETPLAWFALGAAALAWTAWRLFGKPARAKREARASIAAPADSPGRDSAFYRVESHLVERGWQRARNETPREWLARIGPYAGQLRERGELAALLAFHYRLRFDPAGLTLAERDQFSARVDDWLKRVTCKP